jgi:hypothetical protein
MNSRILGGLICAAAAIATAPAHAGDKPLLRYEGAIGSQPLRAAAATNTVAGVAPGGAPWFLASLSVKIYADGTIRGRGRGLLLGGTDNIGTRGGPRQVVASLFCRNAPVGTAVAGTLQTVSYNSAGADVDPDGDFTFTGTLANATGAAPPLDCGDSIDNRPVLLIRTLTPANATTGAPATPGAWFAAGILKRADEDRRD